MTLAIIIVSHDTREDLQRCLQSLADAPPAMPHEIVVVGNASRDGTAAAVRAAWPEVRVIALDTNVGFAAGNNVGIRESRGDLLLLLNSDTIVPQGAVDRLAARLAAHAPAAAAGPRIVDASGRLEISFGRMIAPLAELRQKTMGTLYDRGFAAAERWAARAAAQERYVDWVSGACLLVWRADAEAVGLLDERYFLYTEDVDFCAALRARGRRILFTPDAQITHLRGRSRSRAPRAANAAYRRSQIAFYEKHHPAWAPLLRMYLRLKGALPAQHDLIH
jgi:GT2 family glycosyltransferase